VGGSSRDVRSLCRCDSREMGTKRWDHPSGTCRAVSKVPGPHMVVCHRCRRPSSACHRSTSPSSSCPFVCKLCGTRGEIRDVSDAPDDYAHESWDRRRLPRPEGSVAPVSVAPCCWPLLSVRLTEPPCAISTKPASGREDEIVGLAGLELLERGRVGDHHVLGLRGRAALRAGSRGRGTTLIGITAVVGDLDARTESRLLEISVSACGISVLGRTHECFRPTTPKSIVADGRLRDRLPFVQRGDVEL